VSVEGGDGRTGEPSFECQPALVIPISRSPQISLKFTNTRFLNENSCRSAHFYHGVVDFTQ